MKAKHVIIAIVVILIIAAIIRKKKAEKQAEVLRSVQAEAELASPIYSAETTVTQSDQLNSLTV